MNHTPTIKFCINAGGCNLWNHEERLSLRGCGIEQLFINNMFMRPDFSREMAAKLKEQLADDGLYIMSSHPPFGSYNQPFSILRQSVKGLRRDMEWMKEYILRCGLLGIPAVPLHTGGAMLPSSQNWEVECARNYVRELLPVAESAGVVIAIENTNHATPFNFYPGTEEQSVLNDNIWEFDDTEKILDFVHSFHSPFLQICYDTGHSHLLGRMIPDLDAFFDDIVLFHLHDNDEAGNDAHLQPGYGNTDWKTLFAKIKIYQKIPVLYVEAPPFHGEQALMMSELNAIANGHVHVKDGGFLEKEENTGRIKIVSSEEV